MGVSGEMGVQLVNSKPTRQRQIGIGTLMMIMKI